MRGGRVTVWRGGFVDCVHAFEAVVTGVDGTVVRATSAEAASLPVFIRSAAKALQAQPAIADDLPTRMGLDGRHIALACSSHVALPEQVSGVREILEAARLSEAALACGCDDQATSPIEHACSGNHALGLALCVDRGWPVGGYLEPDHPLQRAMRAAVVELTGELDGEALDNCGMRAYRMPLVALAGAYATLAAAATGALRVTADAMRSYPDLVRGPGEVDTELMRARPGLVAKVGAEGVIAVGLPDGRGLALKVIDGGWRALAPAAVSAVAAGLGLDLPGGGLLACARPPLLTPTGAVAGHLDATVAWADDEESTPVARSQPGIDLKRWE